MEMIIKSKPDTGNTICFTGPVVEISKICSQLSSDSTRSEMLSTRARFDFLVHLHSEVKSFLIQYYDFMLSYCGQRIVGVFTCTLAVY